MKSYKITESEDGDRYYVYRRRWWLWLFNATTFLTYGILLFWPPLLGFSSFLVGLLCLAIIEFWRAFLILLVVSSIDSDYSNYFLAYKVWVPTENHRFATMQEAVEEVVRLQSLRKEKERSYYL